MRRSGRLNRLKEVDMLGLDNPIHIAIVLLVVLLPLRRQARARARTLTGYRDA